MNGIRQVHPRRAAHGLRASFRRDGHRRSHAPRSARRGMVLVFFALLSFVVMGFAALCIDLGIARLTQRQMQSAADGMALEALRERDLARNEDSETSHPTRDYRRRLRGVRFASWQYMDELAGGVSPGQDDTHGAGAYIDMLGGFGSMNASQLIYDAGISIPRPRVNYRSSGGEPVPINSPWGDLVSGEYTGHQDLDGDGLPDGTLGYGEDPMRLESSKYDRVDFTPAEAEYAPFGTSMVARLRRTLTRLNEGTGTAATYDDRLDVSTSGPTLPFLFGLGTTMHGGHPTAGYAPRFDGIGVRATSIAEARRAVRVGPPLGQHDLGALRDGYAVGTAPFVLFKRTWQGSAFDIWVDEGDGNFSLTLTYVEGILTPPNNDSTFAAILQPPRMQQVGDAVYRMSAANSTSFWEDYKNWEVAEAYAPVVHFRTTSGPWRARVIGFVRVRAERIEGDATTPDGGGQRMKLYKLANERVPIELENVPWIAPRNASALFDGQQVSREELAADTFMGEEVWNWQRLMLEHVSLERAVHAPALVR